MYVCVTVNLTLSISLSQTVQLFSYLNDKDMFAEIYRNQVRLLHVTCYINLTLPDLSNAAGQAVVEPALGVGRHGEAHDRKAQAQVRRAVHHQDGGRLGRSSS